MELVSRIAIWAALICYVYGEAGRLKERRHQAISHRGRWVWTLGFALYLIHVLTAFSSHHHWSHDAARIHTALQTEQLIGQAWGWGIYVNYFFTFTWFMETLCWWRFPCHYRLRSNGLDRTVRGFFLFMIVNGAVVFVHSPLRWLGLVIVIALLVVEWRGRGE